MLVLSLFMQIAAVLNSEEDIATFAIKTVDDPRTLNKILYIRPAANTVSFNELVALWEKKIGKPLEKTYMPEEEVLKNIEGQSELNTLLFNNIKLLVKLLIC